MTSPESQQNEIEFYGFDSADMAQLPLGIFKQIRRQIGKLHEKTAKSPDQYHSSSHSSDPNQRHYGAESRVSDYRPNHLGILGDGFGAVGADYANQLAQLEALEPGARISLGHAAQYESGEELVRRHEID